METFEELAKAASDNGLDNLTTDEYERIAARIPGLKLKGKLRYLKNMRAGGPGGAQTGFSLGGYDFTTKDKSLEEADSQKVLLYLPDKTYRTYWWRGEYGNDLHGRRVQFDVTQNDAGSWNAKSATKFEEKWRPERHPFTDISTMQDFIADHDYQTIAVVGTCRRVEAMPDWDAWSGAGKAPGLRIDGMDSPYPVAKLMLADNNVCIFAQFGPYKHAGPNTNIDEWAVGPRGVSSLEDLEMFVKDERIGVIGEIKSIEKKRTDKEGRTITDITIRGLTVVSLETPTAVESKALEVLHEVANSEPASTPSPDLTEFLRGVYAGVAKGLEDIGQSVTPVLLIQAKNVPADTDVGILATAIQQTKDGTVPPQFRAEIGSEPAPSNGASINRSALLAIIKKLDTHGAGTDIDALEKYAMEKFPGVTTEDIDTALDEMMSDGAIYEPALGKVRPI